MSLIVARLIDREVRIISDTKMVSYQPLYQTPLDGGLKCIIISPTCCISFSGNVRIAQQALTPIMSHASLSRNEITSHLLKQHLKCECETDFIVTIVDENISIDRICNGLLEEGLSSAWIGNHRAFETYQENYHLESHKAQNKYFLEERFLIAGIMSNAFEAVIDDSNISSVDDFKVCVTSWPAEEDGFRYLSRMFGSGFKTVTLTSEPTSLIQTLGAEGGSYHHSLLIPTLAGIGAIAVYIREASLGTLFYPAKSWNPILFKNVNIVEFTDAIRNQFGIMVDGIRI